MEEMKFYPKFDGKNYIEKVNKVRGKEEEKVYGVKDG